MKILLTGAGGELGFPLLERLFAGGHELSVVTLPEDRPLRERYTQLRADICDRAALERVLAGPYDVCVHLAALTHHRRSAAYFRVNVEGTRNLLSALAGTPPGRFVHFSTRALGEAGGGYAHSKLEAEAVVRASGLQWTILRPAEVYGGRGGDPITTLARSLKRRTFVPILGDGLQRLSPVALHDIVAATVAAIEVPEAVGGTYVLAGPDELTYLDLVERLEALFACGRRRRVHVPLAVARAVTALASRLGLGSTVPDQIPRLLLEKSSDSSDAVRDLGFRPRRLEEGLALLIARGEL